MKDLAFLFPLSHVRSGWEKREGGAEVTTAAAAAAFPSSPPVQVALAGLSRLSANTKAGEGGTGKEKVKHSPYNLFTMNFRYFTLIIKNPLQAYVWDRSLQNLIGKFFTYSPKPPPPLSCNPLHTKHTHSSFLSPSRRKRQRRRRLLGLREGERKRRLTRPPPPSSFLLPLSSLSPSPFCECLTPSSPSERGRERERERVPEQSQLLRGGFSRKRRFCPEV